MTLRSGTTSVFDVDGSAVIVHAGIDDYATDPTVLPGQSCLRSDYTDAIVNVVRIRELKVVQPDRPRGEAAFGLPDPLRSSKILP
jgi:hypothetical protein